jgi:hypothetical protein
MYRDALGALADLNRGIVIAKLDLFTCKVPRHRIPAVLPVGAGVASYLAPVWWMLGGAIGIPADNQLLMVPLTRLLAGSAKQIDQVIIWR